MKSSNTLFILLTVFLFTFSACSDDDSDSRANRQRKPVASDRNQTDTDSQQDPTNPNQSDTPIDIHKPVKHAKDHTTEEAIFYNESRRLPIRFILKLKQSIGVEIDRTTLASAVKFDETTIQKIANLQKEWFGETRYGLIDAQTVLKIQSELIEENQIHALLGPIATPNGVLVQGLRKTGEADESLYKRCQNIIESYGGYFDTKPGVRNMLAIRGAIIHEDKILRTNTSDLYFTNISEATPAAGSLIHFASGPDLNPDAGQMPFDDVMITVWNEINGDKTEYYVFAYPMSVDPGLQWSGKQAYDGTAHLRDGQYIGRIGRHGTSLANHVNAVLTACYEDIATFDILAPGDKNYNLFSYEDLPSKLTSSSTSRVTYSAINNVYSGQKYNGLSITASGASEVIRDFHINTEKSDGILSLQEVETAEKILANRYPEDEILDQEYPNFSYDEAVDLWIEDHTVRYTDEECQILFGKSSDKFYSAPQRATRVDAYKNLYIRFHDSEQSIAINIHTSPDDQTSSQGCLNIPISSYRDFIYNLIEAQDQSEYLYTLVDSSKIEDINE